MTTGNEAIETIFDADNHYWETSDAFTRHRDPKFADRGVKLPRDFFKNVEELSIDDQRKVMVDNARELTRT